VPKAEPVGEVTEVSDNGFKCEFNQRLAVGAKLYTTPPQQQAEQIGWAVQACSKMWRGEFAEIDAKAEAKRIGGTCVAYALYTSPPQREWAGLTDEDWEKVSNRKNTVLDTFEQGATWAAYKLERLNK
jgi:GH18 family chitinase